MANFTHGISVTSSDAHHIEDNAHSADRLGLTNPAFWYSGGLIALFVGLALYDDQLLTSVVSTGFSWSVKVFGPYWQILLLLTFLIAIGLASGRTGRVILGGTNQPDMDAFRWTAIIFCTLLAGGGVFGPQQNQSHISLIHHLFTAQVLVLNRPRLMLCRNLLCTGGFSHGQLLEV